MRAEPVLDAFAKTEWAETEIHHLDDRIKAFFQTNPYETVSDLNDDGSARVWRFKLTKPLPRPLSVQAGAILHALRSPLDQMVSTITKATGKGETGVSFVFGDTREKFEVELGKMKKLTPDLRALMTEAKPYEGGNDVLWAIHKLNRGDKHRVGLVPLMLPAETRMTELRFDFGLPLFVGCRTGKHLILEPARVAGHAIFTAPTAHYQAPPGAYFEFGDARSPGDESLEFMTTTPNAEFYTDFQPALGVGFNHVAVQGEPVTVVLNEMRQAVERMLSLFEQRFF